MRATEGTEPAWFGFAGLLQDAAARPAFVRNLEAHGIETRPIIAGNLAHQPVLQLYTHRVGGGLPGAEATRTRGVYWGCPPDLEERDAAKVGQVVRAFFKEDES